MSTMPNIDFSTPDRGERRYFGYRCPSCGAYCPLCPAYADKDGNCTHGLCEKCPDPVEETE